MAIFQFANCKRLPEGKVAVPNGMLKSMELEWTKCVFSSMFRCSVPVFLQSSSCGKFRQSATLLTPCLYPKVHEASHSTLWLFNIAMDNHHFLIGKSSKNIYKWTIFHGYIKSPEGIVLYESQMHHGAGRSTFTQEMLAKSWRLVHGAFGYHLGKLKYVLNMSLTYWAIWTIYKYVNM